MDTAIRLVDRMPVTGARVLVLTPSEVVRCGLEVMLKSVPAVGSVHFRAEVDRADRLCQMLRPDIVITFGPRPVVVPGVNVLSILSREDQEQFEKVSDLVAEGYLFDHELTPAALTDGITRLMNGEMHLSAVLMRRLITRQRDQTTKSPLTPREHEALGLLAQGLTNKQIARRLGISAHGAKRHVSNVLAKLNCPNRTMAVAEAIRFGFLKGA
jgi:DNA-binding NarL/FixJ family response regulator